MTDVCFWCNNGIVDSRWYELRLHHVGGKYAYYFEKEKCLVEFLTSFDPSIGTDC